MALFDNWKKKLGARTARKDLVFAVYNALVEDARQPLLYKDFGVPDTLDGRFDAIVLHIALFGFATRKTLSGDPELKDLGKDLVGIFLKDMDRNLREIGVGDLSVGKRVKKMASALYGRIDAYSRALTQNDQKKALAAAFEKNVFRGEKFSKGAPQHLAAYGLKKFAAWKKLPLDALREGRIQGR